MAEPAADPLRALNPEQRTAVEHGIGADADPRALLVIAGAGSGKTNMLAHRVALLVRHGADPASILALTFSRRAAAEMSRRVERIVAAMLRDSRRGERTPLTWSGTFHAIGARLLREYAPRIGLEPSFTIHDREDSADLLNLVRHDLGLATTEKRFPTKGTCLAIYSRTVNSSQPLGAVLAQGYPWCANWEQELGRLFAGYVGAKQRQQVLDYDDLLLYWAQMVAEGSIGAEIGARFDHVLVDEYQDTNRLQAAILLALKPHGRGLTVVGDDAQAIYAFRGATVRNILDFPRQFAVDARVVTLEQNYRSTVPILAAANAVIGLARERFTKNLWSERSGAERPRLVTLADEAAQARYVARQVLHRRESGMRLQAQAVLFRSSHHSAQLELELARREIPFVKFGGLKFLEAAHVKDLVACLRWIENDRDRIAGFRVLQLLPGVGPRSAARALDQLASTAGVDHSERLAAVPMPAAAAADWDRFVAVVRMVRGPATAWPAQFELLRRWYEPHLQRRYDHAEIRRADLLQLESIAAAYPSRERFLTELTLDPPGASSDEAGSPSLDEDYLVLSTIHSAKGQEWRAVYLLNAVDGCLPSDLATGSPEQIDEERRLLYVAMTRARDHLEILTPHRFYVHGQSAGGDRHVLALRTRFIPDGLDPLFELATWPPADPTAAGTPPRACEPAIDIGARVRAMWSVASPGG
jgi:ATP-dependent DNA helicase UvrD/PcrA